MPSRLDTVAAQDFARGMPEVKETVIRRIGSQANRTQSVEAVTEFDTAGGGSVNNSAGQRIDIIGKLEIAADQEVTENDTWVIQDGPYAGVYHQRGLPTSGDGGSKTVELTKRIGRIAKEPNARGR